MTVKELKEKLENCNIWDEVFIRSKIETASSTEAINIIVELCVLHKDMSIDTLYTKEYFKQ